MSSLKRIAFRSAIRAVEQFTLLLPSRAIDNLILTPKTRPELDLVTIAFNNVETIRYQHQFLQQNIQDKFNYIIADNSSSAQARRELQAFCRENQIAYISLPVNHLGKYSASYSHATAVNYVYRHVLRKRRPLRFGIIDHDLFPIVPMRIADYLSGQPFYGPLRKRGEAWYLSGIMSFFDFGYTEQMGGIDYMPIKANDIYLDTGGGNWNRFYHLWQLDALRFPTESVEPFREGGARHGDMLEWFDEHKWLHTINGSCWTAVAEGKENVVREVLDGYLKSCRTAAVKN